MASRNPSTLSPGTAVSKKEVEREEGIMAGGVGQPTVVGAGVGTAVSAPEIQGIEEVERRGGDLVIR